MDHPISSVPTPRSATGRDHSLRAPHGLPSNPGVAVVQWEGHQPLVTLTGDVDLALTQRLEAVGLLLRHWRSLVLIDAAGVSFLDAAGLRAVLGLAGGDACHEAMVILRHPSTAVMRLLETAVAAGAGVRLAPSAVVFEQHPEVPTTGWALTGLPGW